MSKLSEQLCREFTAGDMVRDAGLVMPDDIIRYDDISYGPDEKYNLLDVYRPRDAKDKPLPVIAVIHGGAWVYGDKEVYQYYAMSLAQRGFAVVNFSYRLAPEHKFPAQLEDICAAFSWIDEYRQKYGLDINNLFAVGDSAGGHLLGLFAALCTNPDYKRKLLQKYQDAKLYTDGIGKSNGKMRLRAVALNCGKYSFSYFREDDPNMPVILGDFLSEGGSDEEFVLTDVTLQINEDYPPVFLMTCPGDFLKNQAPLMARALVEKNVPFDFRYYGNKEDPLRHVFHCDVRLEAGQKCNDDETGFFMERTVE